MRWIDLNIDTLKMSGTHFSYNGKLKEETNKSHESVIEIHRVLKK